MLWFVGFGFVWVWGFFALFFFSCVVFFLFGWFWFLWGFFCCFDFLYFCWPSLSLIYINK